MEIAADVLLVSTETRRKSVRKRCSIQTRGSRCGKRAERLDGYGFSLYTMAVPKLTCKLVLCLLRTLCKIGWSSLCNVIRISMRMGQPLSPS